MGLLDNLRVWDKREVGIVLDTSLITASTDISSVPTVLFLVFATHNGTSSGAKIDLFDGGSSGTKVMHFESASGDVSPFGISLVRAMPFDNGITVNITATGASVTLGYKKIS